MILPQVRSDSESVPVTKYTWIANEVLRSNSPYYGGLEAEKIKIEVARHQKLFGHKRQVRYHPCQPNLTPDQWVAQYLTGDPLAKYYVANHKGVEKELLRDLKQRWKWKKGSKPRIGDHFR